MLKTISSALLAVSVLAAPVLAAGTGKTASAPVTKSASVSKNALNANAKMGRHHVKHARHHRFHKKMATYKMHKSSKVAAKHVTHHAKRG